MIDYFYNNIIVLNGEEITLAVDNSFRQTFYSYKMKAASGGSSGFIYSIDKTAPVLTLPIEYEVRVKTVFDQPYDLICNHLLSDSYVESPYYYVLSVLPLTTYQASLVDGYTEIVEATLNEINKNVLFYNI